MRVLWLAMIMFGAVSCLIAEDTSQTKYPSSTKYRDDDSGNAKGGEMKFSGRDDFLNDWCGNHSSRWNYTSDGVVYHERYDHKQKPEEIHISDHDDKDLERRFSEKDIKKMVAGKTVKEGRDRLIKVDGYVHTWKHQHRGKVTEVRNERPSYRLVCA